MIEEIEKHIDKLSLQNKQDEISSYLVKKAVKNKVTPQEIYDYASRYFWTETAEDDPDYYIIHAATINQLALDLSKKKLITSDLKMQFYKLAGDRDNYWGCRNYAFMLLNKNKKKSALIYIEKAFQLADAKGNQEKDWLLYGKILESNQRYPEAMRAYAKVKVVEETDSDYSEYSESAAARARLLKIAVAKQITPDPVNALNMTGLAVSSSKESNSFSKLWHHDEPWFDSVNSNALSDKLDEERTKLDALLTQKKAERSATEKQKNDTTEEHLVKKLSKKYKALQLEITEITVQKQKLSSSRSNVSPENREKRRRHLTEKTFFNARRNKKKATLTAHTEKLIDQRFNLDNNQITPIDLTSKSTRQTITAEEAFQASLSSLMEFDRLNDKNKKINSGIPTILANARPWTVGGYAGTNNYGPIEHYTVGTTNIEALHRSDPKGHRLGDSFIKNHTTYDRLYQDLVQITNNDASREKQLATFMIRYGKSHLPVTLAELQALKPNATRSHVNKFNQICFLLLEKEQSQWHSATDSSYQIGMTVAQARCLIMLQAGFIRFIDVFKNNAKYGVYSKTGLINNPPEKICTEVDKLYKEYLLSTKGIHNPNSFFQKAPATDKPYMVLTRHQGHEDLNQVYGGESDTDADDDGYETDMSMTL